MVRKGYVEQQVEGLARALARMLSLEEGGLEARLRALDRLCVAHTGLDLSGWSRGLAPGLGIRQGLGDVDGVRGLTAARLMAEAALIDPERRRLWTVQALLLASDSLRRDPDCGAGAAQVWVNAVRGLVDDSERSPQVRGALAEFDEASGRFAAAERAWLDLEDDGVAWALQQRVAFYTRSLERSDDELEAGGLPRKEILEMLGFCEGI